MSVIMSLIEVCAVALTATLVMTVGWIWLFNITIIGG